jgi:prevent-host-death family protein
MSTTTVTQLKARLSEQLRLVKSGEEVTITDRGRPIARIIPFPQDLRSDEDLQDLAELGLARLPRNPLPEKFFEGRTVPDDGARLRAAALAEREEGR